LEKGEEDNFENSRAIDQNCFWDEAKAHEIDLTRENLDFSIAETSLIVRLDYHEYESALPLSGMKF